MANAENGAELGKPSKAQAAWQDLELGLMVTTDINHFNLSANPGIVFGKKFAEVYPAASFNPPHLDTEQWMDVCDLFGAKYTVFPAKGGSGFLFWQTDVYDYGMRQAVNFRGGKGDVVKEYTEAAARHGIKTGFYCCLHWNNYLGVIHNGKDKVGLVSEGKDDPAERAHYAKQCEQMMIELLTRYGEISEMWFDGGYRKTEDGGPDLYPIFEKYGRDVMYFQANDWSRIRWVGNEQGWAGDPCWSTVTSDADVMSGRSLRLYGDAAGKVWMPAECDFPVPGRFWGWYGEEKKEIPDPHEKLIECYYNTVGHNANMLLELVVSPDGTVPTWDIPIYERFGKEIRRRFGKSVAETSGEGSEVVLRMPRPGRIDHVVLMEEILEGHRIREYVVEGQVSASEWKELAKGTCVGHKWIHRFAAVEVAAVRLRVTKQAAVPKVKKMAVYCVG